MMHEMFDKLFGKDSPFKGGAPIINVFYMDSPKKEAKNKEENSTLKQILQTNKNIEAGQVTNMHAGGG